MPLPAPKVAHWLNTSCSKDGIAAWVLCPKGEIKTIHIPLDVTRLMDNVRRLAELMSEGLSGELGRQRRDEAADLLHGLNAALIEPLDDKGFLPVVPNELITIIPHGVLFGVPFAALRDKTGRYFIEKHSVAYATALSVLKYARQDKGGTTYRWPPRLVALVNLNPLPDPSRKPLSDTETFFPRIAALYGDQDNTQVYPGPKATAETLNR